MKRKVTFNPELIKEEAKRFKLLTEYSFYHEENVISPSGKPEKPIILGTKLEEVAPEGEEAQGFDQAAGMEDETPTNIGGEEIPAEEPAPESEEDLDFGAPEEAEEIPAEEPAPMEEPTPIEEPVDDEVEIDVTAIVDGTEEAKKAAIKALKTSKQTGEELMNKLADLETRLARMDSVTNKIEDLEKEIVKRNPTPVEKLEMRSLSSYPYNIKLSDYWSEKEGQYDVMDKQPKEYVLTQDDIDNDFTDSKIRDSFDTPLEDQEYEEEDI